MSVSINRVVVTRCITHSRGDQYLKNVVLFLSSCLMSVIATR